MSNARDDKPHAPIPASDFRLLTEAQKYGLYAESVRAVGDAEWKAEHRLAMFNQREQLIRDLQTTAMKFAPSASMQQCDDALHLRLLTWAQNESTKRETECNPGPNQYLVDLLREAAAALTRSAGAETSGWDFGPNVRGLLERIKLHFQRGDPNDARYSKLSPSETAAAFVADAERASREGDLLYFEICTALQRPPFEQSATGFTDGLEAAAKVCMQYSMEAAKVEGGTLAASISLGLANAIRELKAQPTDSLGVCE
jgi:hypothetical protein